MTDEKIARILALVKEFHDSRKSELPSDAVPVSGKIYDEKELQNLVLASLEGWWTEGRWSIEFESKLKSYLEVKYALTVNSGSSANLIAMKTLTSMKLGPKRLKRGDEVITLAAGFPTTINPIIDVGAVPVFIDVEIGTYNADISMLPEALSDKTRAVFFAHTLGNTFKASEVRRFCDDHDLWLIEDNCDALGAEYGGKKTGTFGDLSSLSFYPAHHITTAEGGAVFTQDPLLFKIARSIRDWGRDCWCPTGKDNTCSKRFMWQFGELPYGYDHKYIYSEIGYNLKMTDLQAALGVAQMDKLGSFVIKRRANFTCLKNALLPFEDYFILPRATEGSNPSWFGFPITIKDQRIERRKLMEHLNSKGVGTRQLFAGNLVRQPYFVDNKVEHRNVGDLANSDIVMNDTFWLGVYPALDKRHFAYVGRCIVDFLVSSGLKGEPSGG